MQRRIIAISLATLLSIPSALAEESAWKLALDGGVTAFNSGKYSEASKQFEMALKAAESGASPTDVALCCLLLGNAYKFQGRYGEGEPLYKRSLAIYEKAAGADHPYVATGLNNLASLYEAQGRYGEAEPLYKRSLAIYEKANGADHPYVATALNNLALLYREQGRYAEAEPLYKRSLAIYEKANGADHPAVATSLNNLALLYDAQGRYGEAELLYKRSLVIDEKVHGADHPAVSTSLNNLAGLMRAQGRYAESEPLYKRSLAIRETKLGADHPDVATALNNLALLYQEQGRYAEAEPLYKRSLAIYEKANGADHPAVATSLNNLALLYDAQGRYGEAELLYKRSLVIDEKVHGADHPAVSTSLNNLAGLMRAQGRYAESEPLYKRSLAIRETKLGADHPDVATSLNNLASLYEAQGRYGEAEPLYERSLAIRQARLGAGHPDVATSLNNLALLYEAQGRYGEAEPLYKRSLAIYEKANGSDHPAVALSLHNLASLYKAQGRDGEAEPLYKRSLAIRQAKLGADHPDVAASLNNMALLYQAQGRYSEAEPMYKRILAISEARLGADHRYFAASLNNLASLYKSQGRYGEAEPLYKRSLAIREARLGGDHPDVANSLNNLASLYEAQGRYGEAEPLYKRSLVIRGAFREINPFHRAAQRQRFLWNENETRTSMPKKQQGSFQFALAEQLESTLLKNLRSGSSEVVMPDFEKVLARRKQQFGKDSPLAAETLMQIAIVFKTINGSSKDEAIKALPPLSAFAEYLIGASTSGDTTATKPDSVSAKTEAQLGGRDAALAFASDTLLCLGSLLAANSEDAKARRAFELSEKCCLGQSNASTLSAVDHLLELSTSWRMLSRHSKASELIDRAWMLAAKDDSNDSESRALKLKCKLAHSRLNLDQGDLTAAHDAAKEALDIASKGTGISKVELASCYQLLAECSAELGENDDAIKYAQSALDIPEISRDMKASCLALLGGALLERGDTKEAKAKLNEALDMSGDKDKTLDQSLFASASAQLGYALLKESNLAEARRRFDWAHSWDKSDPSADGALAAARDFSGLAQVEESAGDQALSLRYSLQAAEKVNKYVEDVFPQLSFGEQCAFLSIAKRQRDGLLSVCQDADSIGPAYRFMLKWKGLLLESLRTKEAINAASKRNPALLALAEELSAVRRQLSGLANKSPADLTKDPEAAQRARTLTERKEKLEVELATKSGVSLKDPIRGGADWLREQLHDDEAFIDILPYKPFNANNERYAAVVIKKGKGGEPRFFDLGDTPEMDKPAIDKLVSEWRFAVTGDKFEKARDSESDEDEAEKEAARVKEKQREELTNRVAALLVNNPKILGFINSSVSPARKIWLCPEAAFARVPWNALATISSAAPLSICEVDSPREFVVLRSEKAKVASGKCSIMLAGLKDFKKAKLKDLDGALAEIIALNDEAKERGIERKYLPEERATKDAVKENLELVTLAHIATHGFAAGSAAGSDSDRGSQSATRGLRAGGIRSAEGASLLSTARSPLVECGLYFAFPEEITSSKDELPNVMTAEEMIGLNLKNCDLVTLSACQTGLGRRMNGQGIIGLRSAIMGAGAKSILMSLWSVDDDATRELMKRFYGYIWDEKKPLTKVEALKKAQDEIRAVPKWKDPKFWAGWVLAGDGWR